MSYCDVADLSRFGVRAAALAPLDSDVQQAACDAASKVIDGYLRSRLPDGSLPLVAWGDDIRRAGAIIATYDLLVVRGYNPASGADVNLRMRYEDTLSWLNRVGRQEVTPDMTPQPAALSGYQAPRVITATRRGW